MQPEPYRSKFLSFTLLKITTNGKKKKKKNREFQKSTLSKEQNKKNVRRKSNAHIEGR